MTGNAALAGPPVDARPVPTLADRYALWLADFNKRLALHDAAVQALADDLASRTPWSVRAAGARGFSWPEAAAGIPPDVICQRDERSPLCLEVELPETLVRRGTVRRLRELSARLGYDTRIVLIARAAEHERRIAEATRLLDRVGLRLPVAAIAADEDTITGADW